METWAALLVVLGLAAAHLAAPLLPFLTARPRSWVLSAGAGVSVAYVLVHLLPEVAAAQEAVERHGWLGAVERHAYVIALVGLVLFYGLERAALLAEDGRSPGTGGPDVFWVGMASFALYNGIVGYLVTRQVEEVPAVDALLFALALAVHLVVNDAGLREHHARRYDRLGRPLLVTALLAGWAVGSVVEITEAAVGLVVAFLAGGIILNVLKEELPAERQSKLLPFVLGTFGYAALLLAV